MAVMKLLWGALLLCGVMLAAGLASARDTSAERSMLIALENAWNQAQMHRDGEALNRLIVDTFVYTDWVETQQSEVHRRQQRSFGGNNAGRKR